jgi:predicted ATPase
MQTSGGQLQFVVVDALQVARQLGGGPRVVLRQDNWDDFGFKTTYSTSFRGPDGITMDLGNVKILRRGQEDGRPGLPKRFTKLDAEFCSLGQDIEYYEELMRIPDENLRRRYLKAIRDSAFDPTIEHAFEAEPGWQTSLLRFGQAANALSAGRQLLRGDEPRSDQMSFTYDWVREDAATSIKFEFDDSTELPGRCHALIGYNGVGKTTLLADLANTASSGSRSRRDDGNDPSVLSGKNATFGAVIAISYRAFDTFITPDSELSGATEDSDDVLVSDGEEVLEWDEEEVPEWDEEEVLEWDGEGMTSSPPASNEHFGYVYCGLRRTNSNELKSIHEIQEEFAEALVTAKTRDDDGHLLAAFRTLSREPSFGQAGVDLVALGGDEIDTEDVIEAFGKLSTGHQIVLNIVTQLAAHLRTRSLVLIDEPETHLHPPLVAALLRAIQALLEEHGSFAIAATHSPVVVQELPATYVRVIERYGNLVTLRPPEIETFAENIGAITRHVFSLDSSATDYQGVLAALAERLSVEEIDDLFVNGLSAQGRALVANYLQRWR